MKQRKSWIGLSIACLAFLIAFGPAHAQPASFYKGKTVNVIAPTDTGGSIYEYTLLVSNHLGRHIPGGAKTVAQTRPGGGGVTASNFMSRNAPKDGAAIAQMHTGALLIPMTSGSATYDPRKFGWLGSVAVRSYVGAVWHTVPVNSLDDIKTREVIFGGSGTGSPSYQYPVFLAHITGAKLKVIPGYKSGGETNLALERGEVQGRGNFYEGFLATNADWVKEKKVKFIFKMGPDHPDLAAVPAASKYATTPAQQQMLRVLEAPLAMGAAFYVPPDIPADRLAALRDAFQKMLADPLFKAEADKMGLFINPRSHADLAEVVNKLYDTPKQVMAELEAIIAPKK
ncbi:MAG: Bug family tripartite tricarboxylate transporter substrate binding protein [Burkholderiales bacterium]